MPQVPFPKINVKNIRLPTDDENIDFRRVVTRLETEGRAGKVLEPQVLASEARDVKKESTRQQIRYFDELKRVRRGQVLHKRVVKMRAFEAPRSVFQAETQVKQRPPLSYPSIILIFFILFFLILCQLYIFIVTIK